VSIVEAFTYEPMVGDPDDHRPNTSWALVFDPPRDDAPYVEDLTCIFERMGPGDRIPLHTHTTSEVVMIDSGSGTYRLADEVRTVGAGTTVFIPAGTPHGLDNEGTSILSLHAVFPSRTLDIAYLDRNPAPGTEGEAPQPPIRFDPRVDPV
jgi:mannose-6-phosphate isomerase-like protein (cupin superfamily)